VYFVIDIAHKKQTKANDCWYACVQMLNTWKAGGEKTKPRGEHTMHLHAGLLGHRLHADFVESKHLKGVLNENGLKTLQWDGLAGREKAADPLKITIKSIHACLTKHGPIMVIGAFGQVFNIKVGHYVVVAGVDGPNDRFLIHDPTKQQATWMDRALFHELSNHDDDTGFVCT